MPVRGSYKKTDEETRQRVLRAADNGGDWKMVAEANGIPYKTAYSWIRNAGQPRRSRGGDRRSKITPLHVSAIIEWLEENPQLTLKAISNRVQVEIGIQVSVQTISNRLHGRLITSKKIHHLPVGMNSDENKHKRRTYVANVMELVAAQKTIVYVDEMNCNLFCRRTTGRSRRGTRAVVNLPNSKGPNVHIIGGVSSTGLVYWERRRGSFRKESFNEWLRQCLRACVEEGLTMQDVVIVVDNAPAHCEAELLCQEGEFFGITVLRLAPYSPMLNAIESVWSKVKCHINQKLQDDFEELIAGDPHGILTQAEFRLRHLERQMDDAMHLVTPGTCLRACNHVQQFYAAALDLQDLTVGQ
jgi:transposase